jgi:hypothetical protein
MQSAKLSAQWREAGRMAAAGLPVWDCPVRVVAYVVKPRRGRYDPNNLWPTVKAVVDGVVDAGVLVDDDHAHVVGPDMRHGGVGAAGLVLVFTPADLSPDLYPENTLNRSGLG